jgi:hypothetical protein
MIQYQSPVAVTRTVTSTSTAELDKRTAFMLVASVVDVVLIVSANIRLANDGPSNPAVPDTAGAAEKAAGNVHVNCNVA